MAPNTSFFPKRGGGIDTYATFSVFPALAADGAAAIALDSNTLYIFDLPTTTWIAIGSTTSSITGAGDTNSIHCFVSGTTLKANLLLSAALADTGYLLCEDTIEGDGLRTQVSYATITGVDGVISSVDYISFLAKLGPSDFADLTELTSSVLTISDCKVYGTTPTITVTGKDLTATLPISVSTGTGATLIDTSISMTQADGSTDGWLSSIDWLAFDAKLDTVAVDGITITGDGTVGNPLTAVGSISSSQVEILNQVDDFSLVSAGKPEVVAKYGVTYLIVENSGGSFTLSVGTTAGGTDVFTTVIPATSLIPLTVDKCFSRTATQNLFFSGIAAAKPTTAPVVSVTLSYEKMLI